MRDGLPGKILHGQEREFENNLFLNYQNIVVSNNLEPPLTTHRPMAKPSAWTKQYEQFLKENVRNFQKLK